MLLIASDHGGFELKEKIKNFLQSQNVAFDDLGPASLIPGDDYPDYAQKVSLRVAQSNGENLGILICDTGIGMDVVANKFKNVRAALCTNPFMAQRAREHNNANVLVLGAEVSDNQQDIVATFLKSQFTADPRHLRRLEKIRQIEW